MIGKISKAGVSEADEVNQQPVGKLREVSKFLNSDGDAWIAYVDAESTVWIECSDVGPGKMKLLPEGKLETSPGDGVVMRMAETLWLWAISDEYGPMSAEDIMSSGLRSHLKGMSEKH
jgi:hypothetical protein